MKAALVLILFLFAPALAGPARDDVKRVVLNQEFEIKVGEEVLVGKADLKVSFEAVTNDSRCPVDVTCVWAGNAKVALKLSRAGRRTARVELNTGMEPKQKLYYGYKVRLVKLEPKKNKNLKEGDYVATVVVSRK
jgi:hypothetical protein